MIMEHDRVDNNCPTMLYFMPVDWSWIAQRPHFLSISLQNFFKVTVAYPHFAVRTWKAQKKTKKPKNTVSMPQIPFQERNKVIKKISDSLQSFLLGDVTRYDYIWLGSPLYIRFVPRRYNGKIVYDYMDNVIEMQRNDVLKKIFLFYHKDLLSRADYIFASSIYLKQSLPTTVREKTFLIRNGWRGDMSIFLEDTLVKKQVKVYRLGYVGTISEWMDFNLLLDALEMFDDLEFHFWGPVSTIVPNNKRIIMHGIIEHNLIYDNIKGIDCMIMPFILNNITLAVDPVKLYEYISYGKPIISVSYPELEHFKEFLWLYHNKEEFLSLIREVIDGQLHVKYSRKEQEIFLRNNTWDARAEQAANILLANRKITDCLK